MKPNKNYKNISTKVEEESWELFNRLCEMKGMTPYELVQMVIDTLVRYMDDRHQLSVEMETLINTFENLQGWKQSFNLCDPTAEPQISEATYYLTDTNGQCGARAVMVSYPFMGQPISTYNVQTIAERMFCIVFPDLYRRLRHVGVTLDTNSVIETVERLVQDSIMKDDERTLATMFGDNDYSEHARKPKVDGPYRRKKHRDINSLFPDEGEEIFMSNDMFPDEEMMGDKSRARDDERDEMSVGTAFDFEKLDEANDDDDYEED